MNCNTFNKNIPDFIDGNLTEDMEKVMTKHINDCNTCRLIYENEIKIEEDFKTINDEDYRFNSIRSEVMKSIDKNRYTKGIGRKIKLHLLKYRKNYYAVASVFFILLMVYKFIPIENSFKTSTSMSKPKINANKGIATTGTKTIESAQSADLKNDIEVKDADATAYDVKFKVTNMDSSYKTKFSTPFISSPNKKYEACIEGKGEGATEEGIGKIIIKSSEGKVYSLEIENNQKQSSPLKISWWDDNKILVIIGLGYGTVAKGGSVYSLTYPFTDGKLVYMPKDPKQQVISAIKDKNNNINIKTINYDDNYNHYTVSESTIDYH